MYDFFSELFPHSHYLKKRKEGNLLLVTNEELEFIYLNETAAFLFERSDGKTKTKQIFDEFLNEYDVDETTLKHDLGHIIKDLQWKKLISFSRTAK